MLISVSCSCCLTASGSLGTGGTGEALAEGSVAREWGRVVREGPAAALADDREESVRTRGLVDSVPRPTVVLLAPGRTVLDPEGTRLVMGCDDGPAAGFVRSVIGRAGFSVAVEDGPADVRLRVGWVSPKFSITSIEMHELVYF